MSDTYQFEDVEIRLNEFTVLYAFGELEYEPCWECGDFDYEGPQGPATQRVGMELTEIKVEEVSILWFNVSTMVAAGNGQWMDVGGCSTVDEDVKDVVLFLKKEIREIMESDRSFFETVQEMGEPEYDPC